MVKSPNIRHSKSRREPMTIELAPGEVSRIDAASSADVDAVAEAPAAAAAEAAADSVAGLHSADAEPPLADATDATPAAEPAGAEEDNFFMGSEAPPQPTTSEQQPATEGQPAVEEERVRHAFGRDTDTAPPSDGRRAGSDTVSETPVTAPAASPRRSGGVSAIAAGIIGGVIVLLGAGGLQYAGLLPSPATTEAVPPVDTQALAALKAEIAALKQDFAAAKAGSGGDTTALTQSVTELSTGLQGLGGALDQVKADVAALKSAVESGSAGDGAAVQALSSKLAELQAAVAAIGQGGEGVSQQALDAINQKITEVGAAAAAAVETAKAGEGRLAALEQSVAGLSDQVAKQAAQPKVALAIAAAALKSAIERGGPFTAEVETFAAIAPESPELPALRDIAAKGVASRADLIAEADDAANAMIAASDSVGEDAGFWERLLSSAESLIKVRPIGAIEGDTVPAKVARMEAALKAGELVKAIAEYETLPETSKAAGQQFADKIRARLTAEQLVAKALAGALKSA
jgi:hypothetical protein